MSRLTIEAGMIAAMQLRLNQYLLASSPVLESSEEFEIIMHLARGDLPLYIWSTEQGMDECWE